MWENIPSLESEEPLLVVWSVWINSVCALCPECVVKYGKKLCKCEATKCDCSSSSQLDTDLGEDAGRWGDSAVHHAVENGEQAVQRERLWAQKMVTGLENRQNILRLYLKIVIKTEPCCVKMITFSFFFKKFVFLILPWCCWEETEGHQTHSFNILSVFRPLIWIIKKIHKHDKIKSLYLYKEAFICACGVVGRQVGSDQQELGVIRQFNMSVSR